MISYFWTRLVLIIIYHLNQFNYQFHSKTFGVVFIVLNQYLLLFFFFSDRNPKLPKSSGYLLASTTSSSFAIRTSPSFESLILQLLFNLVPEGNPTKPNKRIRAQPRRKDEKNIIKKRKYVFFLFPFVRLLTITKF